MFSHVVAKTGSTTGEVCVCDLCLGSLLDEFFLHAPTCIESLEEDASSASCSLRMDCRALGAALASMGTPAFPRHCFEFLTEQVPAAQLTAFCRSVPASQPRTVVAQGASDKDMEAVLALTSDYANWGYEVDPNFSWRKSANLKCGRVISSTQISDESYRARFYDSVNLTTKIALIFQNETDIVYLNLYRSTEHEPFSTEEICLFNSSSAVILQLILQHSRIEKYVSAFDFSKSASSKGLAELACGISDALFVANAALSRRESEICAQLAVGFSTYAIAIKNGISSNTVSTHRKNAYRKLGINSQSQLFYGVLKALGV